jgi:hypothetical protein
VLSKQALQKVAIFVIIFVIFIAQAIADPSKKVKFYNFDDLLINGVHKKPQILYIDKRQKVKFERLLKLKKDFIPKLKSTGKDPCLK